MVGEIDRHSVAQVFADAAVKAGTLVYFAQDEGLLKESYLMDTGEWYLDSAEYGQLFGELGGVVQFRNATTVLGAINLLNTIGVNIPTEAVREGFEHVVELTGLMGRWQVLQENPKVVCDTGHNVGGWQYLNIQLEEELKRHKHLFMIVGMVNDKDIDGVLDLMPEKAFTSSRKHPCNGQCLRKILQQKQSSTVYRAQSAIPCRKPWKKHWREPDKTTSSLLAEALSSWRTPYPCS